MARREPRPPFNTNALYGVLRKNNAGACRMCHAPADPRELVEVLLHDVSEQRVEAFGDFAGGGEYVERVGGVGVAIWCVRFRGYYRGRGGFNSVWGHIVVDVMDHFDLVAKGSVS